jgi:gliding motility-associated-like protein
MVSRFKIQAMIKTNIFTMTLLCITSLVIAQESYMKQLREQTMDFPLWVNDFIPLPSGELVTLFMSPTTSTVPSNCNIVVIDASGDIVSSYLIALDEAPLQIFPSFSGMSHLSEFYTFLSSPSPGDSTFCFLLNFETEDYSAWKVSYKNFTPFWGGSILSENHILFSLQAMADTIPNEQINLNLIGVSAVDVNTESVIWSYRYVDSISGSLGGSTLVPLIDNHIAIKTLSSAPIILKINDTGDVVESVQIEGGGNLSFASPDPSGGLLLFDSYVDDGDEKGIIVKLDEDLNLVWSRLVCVENFGVGIITAIGAPDGTVVFSYSVDGDFPTILGRISPSGELEYYRGYGIPENLPKTDAEGRMYIARSFYPDGALFSTSYIIKTDPNGDIDGCPQFDACVTLEEIDIETVPITVTREPIPHIEPTPVSVYPAEFYTEPYCVTPEPPNALFHLPERVCEGTCLSPDSIFNATANHVEWRILGTGLDTLIADTSFSWCFNTPGTYTVEQEVWVLGCSEFYARQLEVLPDDLTPPLMGDTILCQSPPYTLQPQSSRPLSSFLWSDGSMGPVLSVNQGGVITLEAGDGACSVRDTIELQFVEELIPQGPYTEPEDVGLCEQLLPYLYRPYSVYTSEFSLPGAEALPDGSFLLSEFGRYELSTELYDCPFSTAWELQELPCELPVYLPNAFSPNFDGINDYLEPQGIDFEPIRLQVFDRWGGLLFETSQAPFRWDGLRGNQAVNPGVYVVRFEYRNLRTGGVEDVVGDVVVVR